LGSGERYGQSVSMRIFFKGIFEAVSWILRAFLKVTIPLKLIIAVGEKSRIC
jgi:hypothetical protein